MPRKKPPITGRIVVDSYSVMMRAVEEGVAYGWNRSHKHTRRPTEDAIRSEIEDAVMGVICEYFSFDQVVE